MKQTESQLVKACLELLAVKRIFSNRQNTGAFKTDKGFYKFGILGAGDIVAVVDSRHIEIECKTGRNKQSTAQVAYQKELESAGGLYWLIRDVSELVDKLENLKHLN